MTHSPVGFEPILRDGWWFLIVHYGDGTTRCAGPYFFRRTAELCGEHAMYCPAWRQELVH